MAIEVKIPQVGESITEVTVASWNKNDGDHVEMDEVLCELESDKATFELSAEAAGILRIKAEVGATIAIGEVLCVLETDGKSSSTPQPAPIKAEAKADAGPVVVAQTSKTGEIIEMKVPEVGESITEVTLGSWSKKDGDFVQLDEVLAEIESEKATFELTAEAQGVLRVVAKDGQTLSIGDLICRIEVAQGVAAPIVESAPPVQSKPSSLEPTGGGSYAAGHASPAAAKIMAEKGVSSNEIRGSGVDGRITKEDAMKAGSGVDTKTVPAEEGTATPAGSMNRGERREKLSNLRKTISRRLVAVKNETAMLTTFNEVDMKAIMDLRSQYKEKFKEKYDVGLGFMSFFTKACCVALQEWPAVNAYLDGDEAVYNDFCDISIAVSAPRGLVVPVIRNAESLNFMQIEKEVVRLATRARENKLSIEEMTGGTFTITNGGIFGSMLSTPIINAPQSAILGMHNIVERPMAVNGEVVIRPIMYVALSYDHRIIDGRESVSFLVRVKQMLEDPARLLIGV